MSDEKALSDNKIFPSAEEADWIPRVTDINRLVLPELSEAGKIVAIYPGSEPIAELLRNKKTAKVFPWHRSGIMGYEHITDEALEGGQFDAVHVHARHICKLTEVKKGESPGYWIKRFAALFSHLADHGRIKFGMLGPFTAAPLADIETEKKISELIKSCEGTDPEALKNSIDEIRQKGMADAATMRVALLACPYTLYEVDELNEWLGGQAFVEEGAIGTDDWSGLPEV